MRRSPHRLTGRVREWGALLAVVGAITLPFLGKAFHIDDTYYLRVAENIVADPLDPFAGEINWSDRPTPIFRSAGNPPLLDYALAPVVATFGASEVALHAAMIPFMLLLAAAVLSLAKRFTPHPGWVLLFTSTSAGVVVSGNIMLDVPAVALGTAAVAALVLGTDRNQRRWLLVGSICAGLAPLTKYSALVTSAVAFAYPCLKGRWRVLAWAAVPAAIVGGWSLHTWWIYGEPHLLTQLGRPYNRPGHGWRDNFFGLLAVAGSLVYLLPALALRAAASRDRWLLGGMAVVGLAAWGATRAYTSGGAGPQFLFWAITGAALVFACGAEGLRGALPLLRRRSDGSATDSLFLALWLLGPPFFSTLSVPFQAVRHVLPALPPLVLLAFRALPTRDAGAARRDRALLATLLALQAAVAFLVARADADLADSYRDFAGRARERYGGDRPGGGKRDIWYLGHWGWMHYAEQAGFRKLATTGPYPRAGDRLLVPTYVDKGQALRRLPKLEARLAKLDQVVYPGRVPFRTVHPAGAGFYALFTRRGPDRPSRVPYLFEADAPLEIFEVFDVSGPDGPPR